MYGEPAMYYDGLVASTNLNFDDIINHISHSLNVSTAAIRCPAHVEYEVYMCVGWSMIACESRKCVFTLVLKTVRFLIT